MSRNPALVLCAALALDRPCTGIRTIDAAGRIGRRRQFVDIGRAVRPGQSQGALRSQRHRQRREYPAAPSQSAAAGRLLRLGRSAGTACPPGDAALCRRLAADHQPASARPRKPPVRRRGRGRGEQLHRDLPGVLTGGSRDHLAPASLSPGSNSGGDLHSLRRRNSVALPEIAEGPFRSGSIGHP